MTESNYGRCISQPGGYLVRFLQTIDGFRAMYKTWPNSVQMDKVAYKTLSEQLMPLSIRKIEEKLKFEVLTVGPLLASIYRGKIIPI